MFGALAGAALALAADATAAPGGSLEAALAPLTRTLERPVAAYHYATRKKMGLPRPLSAEARASVRGYLRRRTGRYWDLQVPTAPFEMVSGLHLATDPVITRLFGGVGEDWALVDLLLPRGFRYLDVRAPKTDLPPPWRDAVRVIAHQGCGAATPAELVTAMDSAPCRRIATRALAALDVDGILYDYPGASLPMCGQRPGGAFIVLRAEAIDLGAVALHTDETPAGEAAIARAERVREAFLEARRGGFDPGGALARGPLAPGRPPALRGLGRAQPVRLRRKAARRRPPVGRGPAHLAPDPDARGPRVALARLPPGRAPGGDGSTRGRRARPTRGPWPGTPPTPSPWPAGCACTCSNPHADRRAQVVAAERATRLVSIVYYVPGAARGGWEWPKQRKIESSLAARRRRRPGRELGAGPFVRRAGHRDGGARRGRRRQSPDPGHPHPRPHAPDPQPGRPGSARHRPPRRRPGRAMIGDPGRLRCCWRWRGPRRSSRPRLRPNGWSRR